MRRYIVTTRIVCYRDAFVVADSAREAEERVRTESIDDDDNGWWGDEYGSHTTSVAAKLEKLSPPAHPSEGSRADNE